MNPKIRTGYILGRRDDSENFDILAWWKINAKKFPILSSMAHNFLEISLSTVASESSKP
jgi:hypothetical protein